MNKNPKYPSKYIRKSNYKRKNAKGKGKRI